MARCIDADAIHYWQDDSGMKSMDYVRRGQIDSMPIIEAEPKHGRWIEDEKGAKVTAYKCSECGRVVWDDTGYDVSKDFPYCHCGAKMDDTPTECTNRPTGGVEE